jgi:hypothetical protein
VATKGRLTVDSILAERMRRQRLTDPLRTTRELEALVRTLQPLSTGAYARPGSPPRLVHRTAFDDTRATSRLRGGRKLVKGRFLTRARASELKRRFGSKDILQYLLIDGDLRGAICRHWGFKPYDVEDIIVDLPAAARRARRDEILAAVAEAYPPPRHRIQRYAGSAVVRPLPR